MSEPIPMRVETDRAIESARAYAPAASFWRGDVQHGTGLPLIGGHFDLVDDSDSFVHHSVGTFRVLTMTAAPEGYTAIVAVQSVAISNQIPTIRTSSVIKSAWAHAAGTMGAMTGPTLPAEALA